MPLVHPDRGCPQGQITSPSQRVFQIDGWTRGAPGSGVFATKTLELIDGTVTLKLVGRAG